MRGSFCKSVTVFKVVPSESTTVVELTASAETGGVGLNRAVFNSEAVPVAREDLAERVEVVEGWAGYEGVHGRWRLKLFLAGFPSVGVPFAGERDGAVNDPTVLF